MRWVRAHGAIAMALTALGCATASAPTRDANLFGALARRDLAAFEQQIALAERARADTEPLALAQAWMDLVTCRPLRTTEPASPDASLLHAALRAERSRHLRLLAEVSPEALSSTWLGHLHDPDYFVTTANEPPGEAIRWLADREIWIDEAPLPTSVTSACLPPNEPAPQESASLDELLAHEIDDADRVAAHASELGEPTASLGWRAQWHAVTLAHRRATITAAAERWAEAARRSEVLLARPVPPEISRDTRARAWLLGATHRERAGDLEGALALATEATAILEDPPHDLALVVRHRALSLARRIDRRELARSLARPIPRRAHPMCGPIAFEAARLASTDGAVDEVLDIATSVLRDRAPRDRFLAAVLRLALDQLVELEPDARTFEIVEDLGPRHETIDRTAQLATLALEQDRPSVTIAAAEWLRARDPDARNQRRYVGWLALAAFLSGDRNGFSTHVRELTERPEALRRAVGRARESAFFADQDRALSALLGEMLARMAEWEPSRHAERAAWLERVTSEIQAFLQTTAQTSERDALVALYRAASAMLRDTPRGYPEHVGSAASQARAPRVVGRVRVAPPEPAPLELGAVPSGLTSFALIPTAAGWAEASEVFPVDSEQTRP